MIGSGQSGLYIRSKKNIDWTLKRKTFQIAIRLLNAIGKKNYRVTNKTVIEEQFIRHFNEQNLVRVSHTPGMYPE